MSENLSEIRAKLENNFRLEKIHEKKVVQRDGTSEIVSFSNKKIYRSNETDNSNRFRIVYIAYM